MPSKDMATDLVRLSSSLASLRALLTSFQLALESPNQDGRLCEEKLDPFPIFSEASRLLKAHTTKLSLLILNKPFSPKEIAFILDALAGSVLPALMSARELCTAEKYTKALCAYVKTKLRVLWRELANMLSYVPDTEEAAEARDGKKTLSSTGLLWEQCDTLTELGNRGMVWFVDRKIGEYGELLEDAIAELGDWDPVDDASDDESVDGNGEERHNISTPTTSDEEALNFGISGLTLNAQITFRTTVLKHLRLIRLLYPAVRKRRIAIFPKTDETQDGMEKQIQNVDTLIGFMQRFTEHADELAGFLYSDARDDVERRLSQLRDEASSCSDLIKLDWKGKQDGFSAWTTTWRSRLEELAESAPNP